MACAFLRSLLLPSAQGNAEDIVANQPLASTTSVHFPSALDCPPGAASSRAQWGVLDEAYALGLAAKWLGEAKATSSRIILEQYLLKAVELLEAVQRAASTSSTSFGTEAREGAGAPAAAAPPVAVTLASLPGASWSGHLQPHRDLGRLRCATFFRLGQYLDALYRSLNSRVRSREWQISASLRSIKKREREELFKRFKASKREDDRRAYQMKILELDRQLKMDEEDAAKVEADRDKYLQMALGAYRNCLTSGDSHDITVVFRVMSIWFQLSAEAPVNTAVMETVETVPSWKFLPLFYQIASRMNPEEGEGDGGSNQEASFQVVLMSLVRKLANDHPYHTLPQVFALANGDRVKDKQRNRSMHVVDQEKIKAAKGVLASMAATRAPLLRQMEQLIDLYIRVAELETAREDLNRRKPLPRDVRSLKALPLVPVITAPIPIDRSCRYTLGSFPSFCGLADSMRVMNGINAPKVVECLGSDGRLYKQLAKSGNDDLRQDAVMEQLFDLVNALLARHRDTRNRELGIRTYKVVPFTPSAGVLEWVEGTVPLGEYLLGSSRTGGAHGQYGMGDWSFPKCREEMQSSKDKRSSFEMVCRNFRPVLHHFFLERFAMPSDWFHRRLTYTRSVAASSMVGYVVGLGDRHSMNILMDEQTAEVVHIDLGVAFEQGLMLKTPERVPFRLTRDLVDGMGACGVAGVFTRSCEATLAVMRANKEALLIIIEVFIYDPLYKWALSPLKALQRQRQERGSMGEEADESAEEEEGGLGSEGMQLEGNYDATRALLRIKEKLDGFEEGEVRSTAGQVQQLVQYAQDPDRLCTMFPGWGAWL